MNYLPLGPTRSMSSLRMRTASRVTVSVRFLSAALVAALMQSGCAVGPNFKAPQPPAGTGYTNEPLPAQTETTQVAGGEAQRFELGRDLPGEWWKLFGSDKLDALINEATANYPDIAAQQAALRAAREQVRAQEGVFLPQVTGAASAQRFRSSGASSLAPGFPGFISNIYQANVQVSYALDLFGSERRTLEELQAQAVQQNFELETSYLTLTSNVAATAIRIASLRDQIAATNEIVTLEAQQLRVIERQFELGSRPRADVLQYQSNLAAVRATLPPLEQQLTAEQHALAVLTGHTAADAKPVEFALTDLKLPQELPVSLPSALIAQRPDIQLQEMVMREQSAAIGVATANMLPQLTLSGAYGGESLRLSNLLTPAGTFWNLTAGISQPLFHGGALRAQRRAAVERFNQAGATYRLVVLQALQNVADALSALDHDAQALKAEYDALQAATAALDLVQRQYNDGAVAYVALLLQQQAYQQARIAFVQAQASRYADTVTLFHALGGGWWNRNDPGTLPRPSVPDASR
jgi:NodT family efflux transporter outer membrane factor (OMF) lipoprotein